jgi:hypothetical protein
MGTELEPIDSPNTQPLIDKANTLTKPTLKLAIQKQSISTNAMVGNTSLASAISLNVSLPPQSGELIISRAATPILPTLSVGTQAGSTAQETGGPKSSEGSPSFTGGNGSIGGALPLGGVAAGSANSGDVTTEWANYNRNDPTNTLITLKLEGDNLGELLFMLSGLNLPPAELAAFIASLDLPPDELAHLLFELNLPPDALASLIEALGLPPEVVSTVEAELETLEEVEQVVQTWEAANLPLEQLPTFLQQYPDLTLINQITGLPPTWSPSNVLSNAEEGKTPSGTAVAAAPMANSILATQATVGP